MAKITPRDLCIEEVKKHASYVDSVNEIVGIYSDTESQLRANKCHYLKQIKNKHGFKIQMVIK